METPKGDLKQKCTRIGNDQPKEINLNNQTKITDINQYCLELIFINLNLEDLLNVADANKYLKFATYVPFARKYAGKLVKIVRMEGNYLTRPHPDLRHLRVLDEEISIEGLKAIYQMIRCFGEMITDLDFEFQFWLGTNQIKTFLNYLRILHYINEFGAESLRKLSLEYAISFEYFKKPFVNVEDLTIEKCILRKKCLSRAFPKLRRLKLPNYNYQRVTDVHTDRSYSVISDYFPNLHHLELGGFGSYTFRRKVGVINILRLNPHLRSFKVEIEDFNYFDSIVELLQSIEVLVINFRLKNPFQMYDNSIHLKSVSSFQFNYSKYWKVENGTMPKIPITFSQLKEFTFNTTTCKTDEFGQGFLTFINENRLIERLCLMEDFFIFWWFFTDKLQEMLPSLKVLSFKGNFSAYRATLKDNLQYYLPHFEYLSSVHIQVRRYYINNQDDEIRACCANKWQLNRISPDEIVLERLKATY